jgi:uncharacterized protein (AIM24 family)
MERFTIDEFIAKTEQKDRDHGLFELESAHALEVNVNGRVWAKAGAMVGYIGNVSFKREGVMEQGLGNLLKKAVSGEGMTMMKMEGAGRVYLADAGKKITILNLQNQTVFVNGNDLLAMQDGLKWDITMMRKVAGMMAGGLFNVKIAGTGLIAITTHYEPLTLRVTPNTPVFTDPNATVAWSDGLNTDITTQLQLGTFFGRGSGESIQLKFTGNGWVVLQPYEEVYAVQTS